MGKRTDRTGESRIMNNGLAATIILYRNCENVDIEFENGAVVYGRGYRHFKNGSIRCPMLINLADDFAEVVNANVTPSATFFMDIEDLPLLGDYYWCTNNTGYIHRNANPGEILLHRLVANAPDDMNVDHKDGNKLDIRKRNLRICTKAENGCNRDKQLNNTSGYKGVTWNKCDKKWVAQIRVNRKNIHLGYHDTPRSAARAYNAGAIKYHGEFARLNEI